MHALYNEIDPFASQWLRNLITAGHVADGDVDDRSIAELTAADLMGRRQCHFFAGIGVWSYALKLAGVSDSDNVWTGSCPCQPFSSAGRGGGFDDVRHLWPVWFALIRECRPAVILGEQVASPDGLKWLDLVYADLEAAGYAVGSADLCAAGVGAPHVRQRLYFVAHAGGQRREGQRVQLQPGQPRSTSAEADRCSEAGALADGSIVGRRQGVALGSRSGDRTKSQNRRNRLTDDGSSCELGDSDGHAAGRNGRSVHRTQGKAGRTMRPDSDGPGASGDVVRPTSGFWSNAEWIDCTDGKSRPIEPGTFPLAHGATNRVGRLRGYGNAIVSQAAVTFIRAALAID